MQPMPAPSFDLKALESAGPQGALLMPVLQQFGMMQQQMMDQFQQSMQMVVQVFAGMHRDQMNMLQQELDQIQRITRELSELQAEARAARERGPAYRNGSLARPAAPRPLTQPPDRASTAPPAEPQAASPAAAAPTPGQPMSLPPAVAPGAMPDLGDMHDWVSQRIHTLQQDREGRWQKILGYVLGK